MGICMLDRSKALATAVVSALLAPIPAVAAGASTPQVPAACRSARDPDLAARMSRDIRAALSSRQDTVSPAVHDDDTGLTCALAGERPYDSASVVKVLIVEAALRRAEDLRRRLTRWERATVRPVITSSYKTAAGRPWADLGHAYLGRFLTWARAGSIALGAYGYWGLTRTTAADRMRPLDVLTSTRSFLKTRAYGLKLLSQVRRDQRWGVPSGMPRGLLAHIKSCWLPRSTHGRRVHSADGFTGTDRGTGAVRTYRIVVLSHDNPTMAYGVRTIERIAQVVHRGLNQGPGITRSFTPQSEISEEPEGSAPCSPQPGWDDPESDTTP